MAIAYIGVGSNLGDRRGYIKAASIFLPFQNIHIRRIAPIYETEPVYKQKNEKVQEKFLNTVFEVETHLTPENVLKTLETIEIWLARSEKGTWSPRTIDLDLLFYDQDIISTPTFQIPHSEIEKRSFVLKPLVDLIPDFVHPVFNKSLKELLRSLEMASSR